MKLSEIKGERTLDVIADIIEPIADIAQDKDAANLFKRMKTPEGMDPRAFLITRIKAHLPALLRTHRRDVIVILAAIQGVAPDAYAAQLNLVKLTADCFELLTDSAFLDLFTSAQNEAGESSSGSAPANATAAGE